MSKVKTSVSSYEDRGFLGDYARDLPHNVSEPLAKAIYAIGKQVYLSQATRDALAFQHALVKQADEIYQRNRDDPAGYVRDFDGMVGEITRGRSAKNGSSRSSQVAERTKREHMLSIARHVEEENYHASRQIIRDLMDQSTNGMAVPIHLLSSDDGAIREVGKDGLKMLITRTVNDMATEDGSGNKLIAPGEVTTFLRRFNGNIRSGVIADRLERCRTVGEVDDLVTLLEGGKISVPQYKVGPLAGGIVEMDDQPMEFYSPNGSEEKNIRHMVEKRKFEIVRDGITSEQLAVLRDSNDTAMLLGTTQPTVDTWFQEYRDAIGHAIASGDGDGARKIIAYLAKRSDRVPSQVVATIRGAVASGDNAAIQVASSYAMAWHGDNPAALARAFQDDGMTLLRMFTLANQLSTASTTQVGVRERTLKTFSQYQDDDELRSAYDRLAAEYGSDDRLATLVSTWKNNRAMRKHFENAMGESSDSSEQVYSPFFFAALRDQFREYLKDSGGDVAAAIGMMESAISTVGVSRLGTVPSPLMPYCPEEYPGVAANKESLTHAIESSGRMWYEGAVANGEIPDGAEYGGSFLLSDDITESLADALEENSRLGMDHVFGEDGEKIFCPTYVHMVTFSFGGLVHSVPVGRFSPSLALTIGVSETGGMP